MPFQFTCEHCGSPFTRESRLNRQRVPHRYCTASCSARRQFGTLEDRFWARVDCSSPDGCWPFIGANPDHYGRIKYRSRVGMTAHKVAWTMRAGPVPTGLYVCHTCDFRPCVRNDEPGFYAINGRLAERWGHLFLGTAAENKLDSMNKGRHTYGQRIGSAKLTVADVLAIRQRYAAGGISQQTLADEYGVGQARISAAVHRKTWKSVP